MFLITAAMKKGFELSSKGLEVKIKKGSFEFIFDKVGQTTGGGFLMGVEIVPRVANTAMINQNETIKARKMDIHAAHHMFRHSSQATTIATAKYYGWELTGKWNGCSDCTMAKIRQTNLNKNSEATKTKGERLRVNITVQLRQLIPF